MKCDHKLSLIVTLRTYWKTLDYII